MNVNANAIFPKKFFCTWENSSTRDVFSLDAHTRAKGVYAYPRAWILARKAYWSRTPGTGSSWGRRSTTQRRALSSLPPPGFIPNFFLLPGLLFCSQSLWYFVRFPSPVYWILSNTYHTCIGVLLSIVDQDTDPKKSETFGPIRKYYLIRIQKLQPK